MTISKLEIEKRAYELYLARGRAEGKALNDWLDAKLDLLLESLEAQSTSNTGSNIGQIETSTSRAPSPEARGTRLP